MHSFILREVIIFTSDKHKNTEYETSFDTTGLEKRGYTSKN
jgi:hypothetical protein